MEEEETRRIREEEDVCTVQCAGRMEERRIREEEDMWGGGGEADKGRRGYVGRRRRKGFVLRRCGKAGG